MQIVKIITKKEIKKKIEKIENNNKKRMQDFKNNNDKLRKSLQYYDKEINSNIINNNDKNTDFNDLTLNKFKNYIIRQQFEYIRINNIPYSLDNDIYETKFKKKNNENIETLKKLKNEIVKYDV